MHLKVYKPLGFETCNPIRNTSYLHATETMDQGTHCNNLSKSYRQRHNETYFPKGRCWNSKTFFDRSVSKGLLLSPHWQVRFPKSGWCHRPHSSLVTTPMIPESISKFLGVRDDRIPPQAKEHHASSTLSCTLRVPPGTCHIRASGHVLVCILLPPNLL
jgi:hypothetical protein